MCTPKKIQFKTDKYYAVIIPAPEYNKERWTIYTDQTSQFPFQYSYNYDANAILVEPLKDQKAETLTAAWIKARKQLINNGYNAKLYIIDNECLANLKDTIINEGIKFQLDPLSQYMCNTAECAVCKFKDYLLAGLTMCDPDFSIRE